jgi:hypothetical protein
LGGVAAGAAALPTNGHPRLAVVPHIPPPPQLAGCYRYTAVARWHTAACATAAFIQAHFPPPELLAGIGGAGRTVVRNAVKFTAGPLDVSVIAADPNGPVGSESDSSRGGDAYSLQSNEFFTGTNGLQDGVQFTDQSEPVPILGLLNGVCIWQIHAPFSQLANYTSNCATFGGSNPVHAVEGNVFGGLLTVAALTFSGTAGIAVVTPDLYGLGVGNNWNNSSGSILGYGGGSEAVFTNAEYYIALDVSSCLNDAGFIGYSVFCGPVGPLKHATFVTYAASPSTNGTNTVETNNLIPVIGPLPANLPKPLQYFYKGYTAQMAYFASTSGSCFVGRPPFCG